VLHELLGESDVRNYDGSWTEWGNMVDVPMDRTRRLKARSPDQRPSPEGHLPGPSGRVAFAAPLPRELLLRCGNVATSLVIGAEL
jgi:hypothetical protein